MKSTTSKPAKAAGVDTSFGRARGSIRVTEDQALNAVCDARLPEPRHPVDTPLKKLDHELER